MEVKGQDCVALTAMTPRCSAVTGAILISCAATMCFAWLIVDAIPEWLDLISHRTERIRFMKKEEQRLAQSSDTE